MERFISFWALIVLTCSVFGLVMYFLVDCLAMKHCMLPPLCAVHGFYFLVFLGLSGYLLIKAKEQLRQVKWITRRELWIVAISGILAIPVVLWAVGPLKSVGSTGANPGIAPVVLGFGGLTLFFFSFYYFTKFLGRMEGK